MRDFRLRLRAIFFRRRAEHDLTEELSHHVELQTRRNLAGGMSESEARRAAQIQFGRDALIKDECRDQRRINFFDTLLQDLRYAFRGFLRTPLFALTVIVTIALGLGINAAVFTFLNAYVLRPLAVRDARSLYEFYWLNQERRPTHASLEDYESFRRQPNNPFNDTFVVRFLPVRIDGQKAYGELVAGDYFEKLGIAPAMGRVLIPSDSAQPGSGAVIVLSYACWQSRYASDPAILGKKILIRGYPLEVVGVAADGFAGVEGTPIDFWAPVSIRAQVDPANVDFITMYGWLKPEFRPPASLTWSAGQEQPMLTVIGRQITADRPEPARASVGMMVSRATEAPISGQLLAAMSPLIAAFILVLIIACANVANMMLARAMARQKEIGIRLSLGAERSRLIRQLLTESLLLSFPAAALGFLVSQASLAAAFRAMLAVVPSDVLGDLRFLPMTPDFRIYAFMMAAAIVAALLFGLAPAMQATRADPIQAARGEFSSDQRPRKLRNGLVVVQIAGCSLLLIVTGVLVRGSSRVKAIDNGLDTSHAIQLSIQENSRAHVLTSLRTEPLVSLISAASRIPLNSSLDSLPGIGKYVSVSPEFFDVFKIPILRGRNFTVNEALARAPVAIVTQTLARRLFPNADAIGQSVHLPAIPGENSPQLNSDVRVIGIARDINPGVTDEDSDRSIVFLPIPANAPFTALIIRVNGDVEAARQHIDSLLTREDPGAVDQIRKMDSYVALREFPFRAAYYVSAIVGILALILAITGIYGVLSYVVMQRRREIGIRLAIGATERQVVGLVLGQSIRLGLIGLAIGGALALVIARLYASYIDRSGILNSFDWLAYTAAILSVFGACLIAGFFPSLRAARIDPVTTLRYD